MSRLRPLEENEVDPRLGPLLATDIERHGMVSPTTGTYAYVPGFLEGARALDAGITQAGGIDQQLRMLMNLRVANIVGCPF